MGTLPHEVGKTLLFPAHDAQDAEQITRAYEGKWRIKHSFRLLKGQFLSDLSITGGKTKSALTTS